MLYVWWNQWNLSVIFRNEGSLFHSYPLLDFSVSMILLSHNNRTTRLVVKWSIWNLVGPPLVLGLGLLNQFYGNTRWRLNLTFIFGRCRRNSPVVTRVKQECDSKNLTGTFTRSQIFLMEKLTNCALVVFTQALKASTKCHIEWIALNTYIAVSKFRKIWRSNVLALNSLFPSGAIL